ncbi:MAG: hypothetical protein Q9157_008722 [Trypethelium eluteriae]
MSLLRPKKIWSEFLLQCPGLSLDVAILTWKNEQGTETYTILRLLCASTSVRFLSSILPGLDVHKKSNDFFRARPPESQASMTSEQDTDPLRSPRQFEPEESIVLPKTRNSALRNASPASSIASLPYRRSNASLSALFASTSTLPTSNASTSGTATPTAGLVGGSIFSPGTTDGITQPAKPLPSTPDDPRHIIAQAFVPHVAVLASTEVDGLVIQKGFPGGLLQLLRPYGEKLNGKVTVRDSNASSRQLEDFGIRFKGLRDGLESPRVPDHVNTTRQRPNGNSFPESPSETSHIRMRTGGDVTQIEELVDRHLIFAESQFVHEEPDYLNFKNQGAGSLSSPSRFYALYLRRLLSGLPMTPHETFSHPVACVIAISSRTPSPIEELRRLYTSTNSGEHRLPQWVNNEYLRYYVLVHDEEHDDMSRSQALFEQMKRHFGLHCHLLRLRSSGCLPSDDDSRRLPSCDWVPAAEELAEIQRREEHEDDDDPTPCLFESDAQSIRSLVREMVTQSIIPMMERQSAAWNDQVASRRRGLSGRFMSLSKRLTNFGPGSRNSSGPLGGTGVSSNYDSLQGFYRPDAPEAIMRKLADYAFILRDYRLAYSTYDLLRSDYSNDKAWRYYAGANEMTAISVLISNQAVTTKMRAEGIDQALETACYSYITRCGVPYNALRTLALGLELLKLREASAADDGARWASRILENRLVGPVGTALFTERVAACYESRIGFGSYNWGSRQRKAALWAVLATENWMKLEKGAQANKCLDEAGRLYKTHGDGASPLAFGEMRLFIDELRQAVKASRLAAAEVQDDDHAEEEALVEATEELDLSPRAHRKSLIGAAVPPLTSFDTGPLSPLSPARPPRGDPQPSRDDNFE